MSKSTYATIKGAVYGANFNVDPFEGLPVADAPAAALNAYTEYIYNEGVRAWKALEEKYWIRFGSGF